MNYWLNANLFPLNFIKTYFMQFQFKNICLTAIHINYDYKIVQSSTNVKLLGLLIDNTVFWK